MYYECEVMKCYDCEVWASAFINLEFGVEGLDATWSASDTPSPSAFSWALHRTTCWVVSFGWQRQ